MAETKNDLSRDLLKPEGGWMVSAHPRLTPPPARQRGWLFRLLSKISPLMGRPELPHLFPVFHINARLFWAWLFFASRLMPYGRLSDQTREKLILRTAWNCRSRYEWGQHVDLALNAGVGDDEILAMADCSGASPSRHNQVLIDACDQLCQNQWIGNECWEQLSTHYSEKELIEITILVGHYIMVAGLLNNAGIALEDDIEERLQNFYQRALKNTEPR